MSKSYLKLYRHFRERCHELSLENKRLQSIIDSCQMMLAGAGRQANPDEMSCASVSSKTYSPLKISTPRKISFSQADDESDADDVDPSLSNFEPGSNKWECLNDEELSKYLQHKTPSPCQQKSHDVSCYNDETFYEPDSGKGVDIKISEELHETPSRKRKESYSTVQIRLSASKKNKSNVEVKENSEKSPKVLLNASFTKVKQNILQPAGDAAAAAAAPPAPPPPGRKGKKQVSAPKWLSSETIQKKKPNVKVQKKADKYKKYYEFPVIPPKSPNHICVWPRCKKHDPFSVSSIKELEKLSPETRKMATMYREKSPSNTRWRLDLPSSEWIRSRK